MDSRWSGASTCPTSEHLAHRRELWAPGCYPASLSTAHVQGPEGGCTTGVGGELEKGSPAPGQRAPAQGPHPAARSRAPRAHAPWLPQCQRQCGCPTSTGNALGLGTPEGTLGSQPPAPQPASTLPLQDTARLPGNPRPPRQTGPRLCQPPAGRPGAQDATPLCPSLSSPARKVE